MVKAQLKREDGCQAATFSKILCAAGRPSRRQGLLQVWVMVYALKDPLLKLWGVQTGQEAP